MRGLVALSALWLATPAVAQQPPHPAAPPAVAAQPANPHAGHATPPPAPAATPDPHAGHVMAPAAPADPHAGMDHAGMAGMAHDAPIPKSPPPPPPSDHIADRDFPPAEMAAARARLAREHGGEPVGMVMVSLAEHQARDGADGYRWEGEAWYGGDRQRLLLTTEGEGARHDGVETAEIQALASRVVGPYTDIRAGVRQDIEPRRRTYATVGFETLLPYWIELEGAVFLSTRGDLLARLEGTYDLRLTNRLILQPRAELNFAAQDDRRTLTGSGLSNAELGLRLRYEVTRQFAPYVGVSLDRRLGDTRDFLRAAGRRSADRSVVAGLRGFF